jgi:hypothetical protein
MLARAKLAGRRPKERKTTMRGAGVFGKAGFGHRREPYSRRSERAGRGVMDRIVCYAIAVAAILFVAALVLGLIGH